MTMTGAKDQECTDQYENTRPDIPANLNIGVNICYQECNTYQDQDKPGWSFESMFETDKKTQCYQKSFPAKIPVRKIRIADFYKRRNTDQ